MARAPLKSCTWPGCTNQVKSGRCAQHTSRNRPKDQYYSSTKWRKIRARQLADHPRCEHCGKLVGMAGHVDHIRSRRQGGGDESWNLATLCNACHSRKTYRQDGGLGMDLQVMVGECKF